MFGSERFDSRDPLDREEELVTRCLRGDGAAWEDMFRIYHPRLVSVILTLLRGGGRAEQAEEIAAIVWCSLCGAMNPRLRRYDPRSGRLMTFLVRLARREIWRRRRSERSRHCRESRAARDEAVWDESDEHLYLQEFLDTLTEREQRYCLDHLLKRCAPAGPEPVSKTNGWKLRSRVLKKFRVFIQQEL